MLIPYYAAKDSYAILSPKSVSVGKKRQTEEGRVMNPSITRLRPCWTSIRKANNLPGSTNMPVPQQSEGKNSMKNYPCTTPQSHILGRANNREAK